MCEFLNGELPQRPECSWVCLADLKETFGRKDVFENLILSASR